jgi:uncharacterized protein YukE
MVESRNELIDELNDRVAVFEEDKLVLKAALRQLQKEMADEAPKTQKLIDDLRSAREHVTRLKNELDSLTVSHQKELTLLKDVISRNQFALNETESDLKMIGTYVDKLEERLASFAIARRDIEIREEMCNAIEKRSVEVEQECVMLQKQAIEFAAEHDDLKNLLEDLVKERTRLQNEKGQLNQERYDLIEVGNNLRATITSLLVDVSAMEKDIDEWKARASILETKTSQQSSQLDDYAKKDFERNRAEKEALELDRLAREKDSYERRIAEEAEIVSYEIRAAEEAEKNSYELRVAEEAKVISNELRATEKAILAPNQLRSAEKALEEAPVEAPEEAPEEIIDNNPLYIALQISEVAPNEIHEQGTEHAFLEKLPKSIIVSNEGTDSRNVPKGHDPIDLPKLPDIYDKLGNLDVSVDVKSEENVADCPSALPPQINVSQPSLPSPHIIQGPFNRQTPPLPFKPRANGVGPLPRRNVPLRKIRKSFSKATGIHGMFTPPSHRRPRRLGPLESMKRTVNQYTSQILRKKK